MRKVICQKCYDRHHKNWHLEHDTAWRNGWVLCPGTGGGAHGYGMQHDFKGHGKPPESCFYLLEQIIGSEKHGLNYLRKAENERLNGKGE